MDRHYYYFFNLLLGTDSYVESTKLPGQGSFDESIVTSGSRGSSSPGSSSGSSSDGRPKLVFGMGALMELAGPVDRCGTGPRCA